MLIRILKFDLKKGNKKKVFSLDFKDLNVVADLPFSWSLFGGRSKVFVAHFIGLPVKAETYTSVELQMRNLYHLLSETPCIHTYIYWWDWSGQTSHDLWHLNPTDICLLQAWFWFAVRVGSCWWFTSRPWLRCRLSPSLKAPWHHDLQLRPALPLCRSLLYRYQDTQIMWLIHAVAVFARVLTFC